MNIKRILLILLLITEFNFLITSFGFSQGRVEENIIFSGEITNISYNDRFIMVNKMKVLVPYNTKILNEKGDSLTINDLKPKLYVRIEGVQNPNGILAKKILVKKRPEV